MYAQIPAGVQPGSTLMMKTRGVPKLSQPNQRGDHFVTVKVSIPQKLSKEEKKARAKAEREARKARKAAKKDAAADDATVEEPS